MNEYIAGKTKYSLSYLYGKMVDGKLDKHETFLVMKILKVLATDETAKVPIIVFSNKGYLDLSEKEPAENF